MIVSSGCPCPGFLGLGWTAPDNTVDHCQEAGTSQAEAQASRRIKYNSLKCRFLEGPRLLVSLGNFLVFKLRSSVLA